MSEGTQQTEKVFCNTCNTVTNHILRKRYSTRRVPGDDDDPDPVRYAHRYSLWCCAGCDEATLEKQWASEDIDSEWEGAYGEYYPRRLRNSIPAKSFRHLKSELVRLYKEIVTCFNEDSLLLCTIGLRVLIEGVCKEKGIKEGNLEHKVKALSNLLPSRNMIEALQALRIFGNDAAHELEPLTRDDARTAIEVMEHLLDHFYEMDYKASQVRNPKKDAFDAVKPGSVQ